MKRTPCLVCGTPTVGNRCPIHARPTGSAHARGYGRAHQRRTADAIAAEPWCHTAGGCPFPDGGTSTNPLTGGHPLTLAECDEDWDRWTAQAIIPQCHRCNSGHHPVSRAARPPSR